MQAQGSEPDAPLGRPRIPEYVVRREFGGQTVILNLKTGQYHGLNVTGGRMLAVLAETGDTEETARRVAEEFEVPGDVVAADLQALCAKLAERGLIVFDAD